MTPACASVRSSGVSFRMIRTLGFGTPPPSANVSLGRSIDATTRAFSSSHLRMNFKPGLLAMLRGSTIAKQPPGLTYFNAPSTNSCSAGMTRRASLVSNAGSS